MNSVEAEAQADNVTVETFNKWKKALEIGFSGSNEEFLQLLEELLDEKVVMKSPAFWKPKDSKEFTKRALLGLANNLKEFHYTRRWLGKQSMALEFSCRVGEDGPELRGIDLISLTSEGKILEIELMRDLLQL